MSQFGIRAMVGQVVGPVVAGAINHLADRIEGQPAVGTEPVNVCCVLPPAVIRNAKALDPAWIAAQERKTQLVNNLRRDAGQRNALLENIKAAFPFTFRFSRHVPRRIRDQVVEIAKKVSLPMPTTHTDEGTTAGVRRVLLDAQRTMDLKKAKVLRVEGMPPTGDALSDQAWVTSGVAIRFANEVLSDVRTGVDEMFPQLKEDNPVELLDGDLVIAVNVDEDPTDEYGWANAAAISVPGMVGVKMFGYIGEKEAADFEDPRGAESVSVHEDGHLVEGKCNPIMMHSGETGTIGEAFGDQFAIFVLNERYHSGAPMPGPESPDYRKRWGIGHDFLKQRPDKGLEFLRHSHERAHQDDGPLGPWIDMYDWPQHPHHKLSTRYRTVRVADDGGEHLDASVINFVQHRITLAMNGDMKKSIRIFALAIAISQVVGDRIVVLDELAYYEMLAARHLYGDAAAEIVRQSWHEQAGFDLAQVADLKVPELQIRKKADQPKARGRANQMRGFLAQGLRSFVAP